ncbi:MAG: ABC transporter permease [Ethanoligenens sp.]
MLGNMKLLNNMNLLLNRKNAPSAAAATGTLDGRPGGYNGKSLLRNSENPFLAYFKENLGILIGFVAICIIMSFLSPVFLTGRNILNVLQATSSNLYLACGMTMVIILGGIDLSVGSIIAMSGVVASISLAWGHLPLPIAILFGVGSGLGIGMFNGIVTARTTIPSFIITLATMNVARGIAYVATKGQPISVMSPSFTFIGAGSFLGVIPMPIIYMVIIFLLAEIILNKTKFGRYVYAIGGNEEAAKFSGVKTGWVAFLTFSFSGLLAGIAGVVLASRMFSGQPTSGTGAEMDAIAAVVLGGTSMSGGVGKLGGTLIGVLVIGVLNNALNLLNVNSFWQYIVKGVVILIAVYTDYIKRKKAAF